MEQNIAQINCQTILASLINTITKDQYNILLKSCIVDLTV